MPGIRGNSFATINRWLAHRLGGEDYDDLLSAMRQPVANILTRPDGWSWYPLEYLSEILENIHSSIESVNGEALESLGSFLAEEDLGGGAPKVNGSRLPMPRVLVRIPYLWSRSMDCGDFSILLVSESENKASLCLSGYNGTTMHCALIRSWLKRCFELLSGAVVAVTETSCRHKNGGSACHWDVNWDP